MTEEQVSMPEGVQRPVQQPVRNVIRGRRAVWATTNSLPDQLKLTETPAERIVLTISST